MRIRGNRAKGKNMSKKINEQKKMYEENAINK